MKTYLSNIAVLVKDYDESIQWYTDVLGFELLEDTTLTPEKRWVRLRPDSDAQTCILLAKASTQEQNRRVGDQTGGRVFLFLHTDDFDAVFERLTQHKVDIVRPPSYETYGRVLVFRDINGNLWDLIQPTGQAI